MLNVIRYCLAGICILAFLSPRPVVAQPQPQDMNLGSLRGTLKTAAGPVPENTLVMITIADRVTHVRTDANGFFLAEGLPEGIATVTAYGMKATVKIVAGFVATVDFSLKGARTVTQTVFDAAGGPVPHAEVYASYAWQHRWMLLSGVASADGVVTWPDLPPVRVIVWGKQVPAGVIPPDADHVTAPLPAPEIAGQAVMIGFSFNDGNMMQPLRSMQGVLLQQGLPVSRVPLGYGRGCYPRCGAPFSFLGMSEGTPPKIISLLNVYAPYVEGFDQLQYPVTLQDGAAVHVHFISADGQPVANLSSMELLPTDAGLRALYQSCGLAKRTPRPDGVIDLFSPITGNFTAAVDLFAAGSPATPTFAVKPGESDVTITLPKPLFTAPAGATLCYFSAQSPGVPRTMKVAAQPAEVPIYSAADNIYLLWYRKDAGHLVLWRPDAGVPTTLALRDVTVTAQNADGAPIADALRILPMLSPVKINADTAMADLLSPEMNPSGIMGAKSPVKLWPGRYIVSRGNGTLAGVLDVPTAGNTELTVRLAAEPAPASAATRELRFKLSPPEGIPMQNRGRSIEVAFDMPVDNATYHAPIIQGDEVTISVPESATTMSLNWLGVGWVQDVALPAPGGMDAGITSVLPAWNRGVTLSGVVVDQMGAPCANRHIPCATRLMGIANASLIDLFTDTKGKFSISGVRPTSELFLSFFEFNQGVYLLQAPEKDQLDLRLQLPGIPTMLSLQDKNRNPQVAWWLPDTGTPSRIPIVPFNAVFGNQTISVLNPIAYGPGYLWIADKQDVAGAQRMTVNPGFIRPEPTTTGGPTLDLVVPLNDNLALPGAVTLTGTGMRGKVVLTIAHPAWQPLALLGWVTTHIDGVPPGDWQLHLSLPGGKPVDAAVTITTSGAVVKLAEMAKPFSYADPTPPASLPTPENPPERAIPPVTPVTPVTPVNPVTPEKPVTPVTPVKPVVKAPIW